MREAPKAGGSTPSETITNYIANLSDWRGPRLAEIRRMINAAAPNLSEDWKWNTPVWANGGNVLAVGAFKEHIKINFFKGASLPDPSGLFNAGLDAKATRAIDLCEGDMLDDAAFADLVRAAAGFSGAKA